MVARIDELQVQPDGRAYLEAMITHPVVVLAHFVEPGDFFVVLCCFVRLISCQGSGGLAFAVCSAPTPDAHMLLDRGKQIRALNRFTSVRTFCRSSKVFLLHAFSSFS
jgi:hypothetical protein